MQERALGLIPLQAWGARPEQGTHEPRGPQEYGSGNPLQAGPALLVAALAFLGPRHPLVVRPGPAAAQAKPWAGVREGEWGLQGAVLAAGLGRGQGTWEGAMLPDEMGCQESGVLGAESQAHLPRV